MHTTTISDGVSPAVEEYFNIQQWDGLADPTLTPDDFMGCPCVMAIDLSSFEAARILMFRKQLQGQWHFYAFQRFYRRDFAGLIGDGRMREQCIAEIAAFGVSHLCYDPYNSTTLARDICSDTSAQAFEVRMLPRILNGPMNDLRLLMENRRIHHDGNSEMSLMMSSVAAHTDSIGNVIPGKKHAGDRIYGPLALIFAMANTI